MLAEQKHVFHLGDNITMLPSFGSFNHGYQNNQTRNLIVLSNLEIRHFLSVSKLTDNFHPLLWNWYTVDNRHNLTIAGFNAKKDSNYIV